MIVQVRLFAGARHAAGSETAAVELPEGAVVGDLRRRLIEELPGLAPWQPHLLFAVDRQFASDNQPLAAEQEIACFPPVSGG